MRKQFNHAEALEAVYSAIVYLRQSGAKNISISEVSSLSGVSRATLYTKHKDWEEVRDVIKTNKQTRRVKTAKAGLEHKELWEKDLMLLEAQVDEYGKEMSAIKDMADTVYNQLLGQLHKYVMLSKETPERVERNSKLLREVAELRQHVNILEKENSSLKVERSLGADVRALAKKEIINAPKYFNKESIGNDELMDEMLDIVNVLDDYYSKTHGAKTPKAVYVMCGNYAAGKSTWIKQHKPNVGGVNLYIDGTNHSKAIRKSIVKRVRKLSKDSKLICVRCRSSLKDSFGRNALQIRKKSKSSVMESLIKQVDSDFDEVTLDEGFDEIVVV